MVINAGINFKIHFETPCSALCLCCRLSNVVLVGKRQTLFVINRSELYLLQVERFFPQPRNSVAQFCGIALIETRTLDYSIRLHIRWCSFEM